MMFISSESAVMCGVQDHFFVAKATLIWMLVAENCKKSHFSAKSKCRK
jgi:hypothetical protein